MRHNCHGSIFAGTSCPLASLSALLIGAAIYVLWRPSSLLVFDWIELAGLHQPILELRHAAECLAPPDWALYSLPTALWTFSLTLLISWVWRDRSNSPERVAWLALALALTTATEILQATATFAGTFDSRDLLANAVGFAAGFIPMRRL